MAAVDPLVALLLLILLGVVAVSLALALRHPLPFRIGMRNVRRGRSRTILLILGLLVGTTIISGSLVVGDTVNQLDLHYTYLALGYVDETIYNETPTGGHQPFPYSTYSTVASAMASDPSVTGVTPMIVGTAQALDRTSHIPQTNLHLIGVDGAQSGQLGPFVTDAGVSLAGPAAGHVLVDDLAAASMNASAGDTLELYGAGALPMALTVQGIVRDDLRGAFLTGGIGDSGGLFVALPTAQNLTNLPGAINFLAVTNAGSQKVGVSHSDAVSARLNTTVAGIANSGHLVVHEELKDALATAASSGSSLSTLFLVLGLFSIVAGAMLIVGIFVMLSEERKGEMGMLRAVGLRRGELVYAFYFEGLAYSAGSALAGTLLGVGVGYGLTYAFSILFPAPGLTQAAILDSFTINPTSMLVAYVAGFLLTIITVALASRRASRLNIVRAIRDIPEPQPTLRLYTVLAYLGAVALLLGLALFALTYRGATDISEPIIGGAFIVIGGALVGSRFLPNRVVFSIAGAALLIWAGIEPLHGLVLGDRHTGGIFIVFVEGILMVAGALFLYVFNSVTIVSAIQRLAGRNPRRISVMRVALSYPARQPTRTTINLAIFSLVIFTLVAIATFGTTLQANLDRTVAQESGGYTYFAFSATPLPDLPQRIANNATLAPLLDHVVPVAAGDVGVTVPGFSANPFGDTLYAAPSNASAASNFYDTEQFGFSSTWHGMTPAAVLHALATNTTVAIVDQTYAPPTSSVNSGPTGPPHPVATPGQSITLTNPTNGNATKVLVLGVLSESFVNGIFTNPAAAGVLGYHTVSTYFLTSHPGVSTVLAARALKAAFFPYGLVLFDFRALLSSSLASTEGVIGLLQIFVGLGLGVGIAGMGIVALRAVVERRREIGMLRASGFTQGMILRAFLLEYSFVALLGIAVGTALGLLIVYDLVLSPSAASVGVSIFAPPWFNLALILLVTYALAMAAVAGPSWRAARLPPADAVRTTE